MENKEYEDTIIEHDTKTDTFTIRLNNGITIQCLASALISRTKVITGTVGKKTK